MLIMHKDKTNFGFMILDLRFFCGLEGWQAYFSSPSALRTLKSLTTLMLGENF